VDSTTTTSISFASTLLLVVVVLTAAGCGDSAQSKARKADCVLSAANRGAVDAVRKAFNAGRLGTADQLASSTYFRHDKRGNFLDPQGHLLSYDRLMQTPDVSYHVLQWVNELQGPVGVQRTAARDRAKANAAKHC
jgi:hypothetical protein